MATETFELELDDGSKTFDVEVIFYVEPTEYEGPYLFYAGGYSAEEWLSVDGMEQEIIGGRFVGQNSGESVDDFILRYADEHHEGRPPTSRYQLAM